METKCCQSTKEDGFIQKIIRNELIIRKEFVFEKLRSS